MKELIKIKEGNGKKLVSAKELYDGLGLNRSEWSRWYKRNIESNDFFEENVDWARFVITPNRGGKPIQDFAISLEFAKHLAMMARTEKSHEYRNYFIECERNVKEDNKRQLPQDYLSALKALVASEEEKLRLIKEKENLIHQGKLYTATEIAKELGFKSANAFNKDLEAKKIQYKCNNTWVLNARYSEMNYTSIKQIELDNGRVVYDRKFTGKGREWLINKIYNKSVDK